MNIHKLGVLHNDLHEGNIRLDKEEDKVWIVDFGNAREHKCEHAPIYLGRDIPERSTFKCPELYDIAVETRTWCDYGKRQKKSFVFCDIICLLSSGLHEVMGATISLTLVDCWEDLYNYTPNNLPEEERDNRAKEEYKKVVELKSESTIFVHLRHVADR